MSGIDVPSLEAELRTVPLHEELDLRVASVGGGELVLTAHVDARWTNRKDSGIVHGGIVAALLDVAACWSLVSYDAVGPAIDLHVNYLRATPPGDLTVTGTVVRPGRTVSVARARLVGADGRTLAEATGTYASPAPAGGGAA
ncbi:MAG: PaaI family thioesterase [Actinomycetaceae bacterium]